MADFDPQCTACSRLARHLDQVRREYPHYHASPVRPFGPRKAQLLIVGLAPGMHGANRTSRPFTGDHAGILLYQTLHKQGFANRGKSASANDGLRLTNCRVTNAVKCLPPGNKPLPSEVAQCNKFLVGELARLSRGGVVVALGVVAHRAVLMALCLKRSSYLFRHGARHWLPNGLMLLDSYHCSRYNTQTRRLTPVMFNAVIRRARVLLKKETDAAREP